MFKENLDNRICDVIEDATSTETFREFIRNTEYLFGVTNVDVDSMEDEVLIRYVDFLVGLHQELEGLEEE